MTLELYVKLRRRWAAGFNAVRKRDRSLHEILQIAISIWICKMHTFAQRTLNIYRDMPNKNRKAEKYQFTIPNATSVESSWVNKVWYNRRDQWSCVPIEKYFQTELPGGRGGGRFRYIHEYWCGIVNIQRGDTRNWKHAESAPPAPRRLGSGGPRPITRRTAGFALDAGFENCLQATLTSRQG